MRRQRTILSQIQHCDRSIYIRDYIKRLISETNHYSGVMICCYRVFLYSHNIYCCFIVKKLFGNFVRYLQSLIDLFAYFFFFFLSVHLINLFNFSTLHVYWTVFFCFFFQNKCSYYLYKNMNFSVFYHFIV